MDKIVTGTDVLKAALFARNAKINLLGVAKDTGVAVTTLEDFLVGKAVLTAEALDTLARYLFPGAVYDSTIDRLRPALQAPPLPMGIAPPPIDPKTLPVFKAGPAKATPQPVVPVKPVVRQPLPGWKD